MPFNKAEKTQNRQNNSSFKSEAVGLKLNKLATRPPSMNGINKQLP
ncbi:hypothetical protein M3194_21650 [Paenibacillus glycanilyticus]|nr:hypothetical protein [Paenibacillus glycanilyticus]MCM3629943.1 hypothetical protein [Paenibacillus glycanilyticus]